MTADEREQGARIARAATIGELRAELAERFAALMQRAAGLRAALGTASPGLAGPIARLAAALQAADAGDQRLRHVEAMARRSAVLDAATRRTVRRVMAAQLASLAASLEETAGQIRAALGAIRRHADAGPLAAQLEALHAGVEALAGTAAGLGRVAEALAADPGASDASDAAAADHLGWLTALYTMDAEREAHRRALARATVPLPRTARRGASPDAAP